MIFTVFAGGADTVIEAFTIKWNCKRSIIYIYIRNIIIWYVSYGRVAGEPQVVRLPKYSLFI